MAGMSFIVVAVGMLTVVFAGDWMLWIFGSTYMDYYHILVILSVGTALNAANGPAPSFLMLTGHEGRYTRIVTGSVILRLAGFFVFVPTFGIVGAAVRNRHGDVRNGVAAQCLLSFDDRYGSLDPSFLLSQF